MKPFRRNVAVSIDGGGIKGLMVARALEILEGELGRPAHDIFRLAAGTSTGSIIAAGIGVGVPAAQLTSLYKSLGPGVFRKTLRSAVWPLTRYRYDNSYFVARLNETLGEQTLVGDLWRASPPTDVVITIFDVVENRNRFIKPWKPEYSDWSLVKTVLASSTVPTYFPVVDGRWADGGVGGYANPAFLAAYEICRCLCADEQPGWAWDPAETTLISLGTGRAPHAAPQADCWWPWQWLGPLLVGFLQSADDREVHLVSTFFRELDFRRFQVPMLQEIQMDDASEGALSALLRYGDELGRRILNDETDQEQDITDPFHRPQARG
jgi:hypothetical protein